MDYTFEAYTVTIHAGQTTAIFDLQINDDSILEGDENLKLTINSSLLRDGVTRGNPGEATVTIVDNDCKYRIYCIASNYGWSHINARSCLVAKV